MARVEQEPIPLREKNEIIEVITTIAVYKFSHLTREEVEAMLGHNLEETRIYQDLEHQTKRKTAARLLKRGYSIENVAEDVELSIEEVRQIAEQL